MAQQEKPDAADFRQHLENLKQEKWLGTERQWWPDFLFHHTNILNVVGILTLGELISRKEALSRGISFSDSASQEVLSGTNERWKDHVRFYFRPKTPTLYHVEGIRPKFRQSFAGAHCPVPIYLLFDSKALLCAQGTKFSTGSLASSGTEVFSSAREFKNLPFNHIYHTGRLNEAEKRAIIYHRHAEVIVPQKITLSHLKRIWCRSQAEYETLHYLLPPHIWQKWRDRITARDDYSLFNREWVYVNEFTMTPDMITLRFNPPRFEEDTGPFKIYGMIREVETGKKWSWKKENTYIYSELKLSLPPSEFPTNFTFRFEIDDNLVYANEHTIELDDIPF